MDLIDLLAQKRDGYVRELAESLDRIVGSLSTLDGVRRVSVFGSYARGRRDLLTDLDVLVVMVTDLGFVDRLKMLYTRVVVPVSLDMICYTPAEFESMSDGPFLKRILQEEKVLYEADAR